MLFYNGIIIRLILNLAILNLDIIINLVIFLLFTNLTFIAKYDSNESYVTRFSHAFAADQKYD